ncbi:hypothetical protein ACO1K4_14335, partial [Staphylococcus aureus]
IARNAAPAAVATPVATSAPDSRLAELTARLRADNARMAERAQKLEPAAAAQVAAAVAPVQAPAQAQQRQSSNVERAALAAIAAAVAAP